MMEIMLAHQGGWDEILMFAVPAGLAIFGLRWAERRARERAAGEGQEDSSTGASDGASSGPDDRPSGPTGPQRP